MYVDLQVSGLGARCLAQNSIWRDDVFTDLISRLFWRRATGETDDGEYSGELSLSNISHGISLGRLA